MILSYQNIFHYLLSNVHKLEDYKITQDEISQGTIRVISFDSSLNNNFLIERDKNALFLKQSFFINIDRKEAFENERTIINNLPIINKNLIGHLPEQLNFVDDSKLVSIQKFIKNSQNLNEFITNKDNENEFDSLFKELGRLVKIIHKVNPRNNRFRQLNPNTKFPFDYKSLDNPALADRNRFWRILSKIQSEKFKDFYTREKKKWFKKGYNDFIHRDLRVFNILRNDEKKIIFIDWETYGIGDRLWDVATLFFDNDLDIDSKYLDIFLDSYIRKKDDLIEIKQKIKGYKILIRLTKLARRANAQDSLTKQINQIITEYDDEP